MVFGEHNPAALSGFSEPVFVLGIGREVVVVDVKGYASLAGEEAVLLTILRNPAVGPVINIAGFSSRILRRIPL